MSDEKKVKLELADFSSGRKYGQFWVLGTDYGEPRPFYTDDDGADWDIYDMRDALLAICANTAPNAISLSLENRINAIHEITKQVVPKDALPEVAK